MLEFGVSGLLYESNLVMYDRGTESLWSQSTGRCIVGEFAGVELELMSARFMSVGRLRDEQPDAVILSEDTGYSRDYRDNPYAGYEESDRLITSVTGDDDRYPVKELMLVTRLEDAVVAIPHGRIPEGTSSGEVAGHRIVVVRDGAVGAVDIDGEPVPTYLEMWFSVVSQNDTVHVWDPSE